MTDLKRPPFLLFISIVLFITATDLIVTKLLPLEIEIICRIIPPWTIVILLPSWLNREEIGLVPSTFKNDLFWATKIASIILLGIVILGAMIFFGYQALMKTKIEITTTDLHSLADIPKTFLYMCIVAPLSEELIYRGLWVSILDRFLPHLLTIISSGILFALLHLYYGRMLIWSIEYFLVGCFLAWIFLKTRNLWVVVYLHCLGNFAVLVKDIGILLLSRGLNFSISL